jgi:hypothetical protein
MSQNGNQFVELISRKILVKNKTGTIKEMQVNMGGTLKSWVF